MPDDRSDERPEGIEERLRSSLRAYAELVDAPATDLPAVPAAAPRRTTVRRWRGALLAAAAAAAVVTGSVWFVGGDASDTVAGSAVGSDRSAAADTAEGDSMAAAEAGPGGPIDSATAPLAAAVGTAYPVDLYTHCGVLGIDIGGVWFAADPPLVEGPGSPPAGWDNPYQHGTVTLVTADEAVFADGAGHLVQLRADESARPAPCD